MNMSTNIQVASDIVTVSPDVKLYYEIRSSPGLPSSKESIKLVMIMGAFATMRHFEEQAEYLVNYFSANQLPIEILTYDHRGIGKSLSTQSLRQTTRMLADDALFLINHLWGIHSTIHIYGASLGGMIAQELALLLIPSNRLRSLYLAVTSRGSYVRPMSFGPRVWTKLMPFLIKKDREHMVRNVLLPASFTPETIKTVGEKYATIWINEYDQWWAFDNANACACQASAAGSHYLTNQGANIIRNANIPIVVQIATQDKLISAKKQNELADLLGAKRVSFDEGHMGNEEVKQQIFQSVIQNIENLI